MVAPVKVQAKIAQVDGAATCPVTFDSNVTAGNLIVVLCGNYDNSQSANAPTDTQGNTYAIRGSGSNGGGYWHMAAWTTVASSTGALVITLDPGAGSSYTTTLVVYELSGADISSIVDQIATFFAAGATSLSIDLANTTNAEDFIIGLFFLEQAGEALTAANGFTKDLELTTSPASTTVIRTTSATGNYDPSATRPDACTYGGIAIAIKGVASGVTGDAAISVGNVTVSSDAVVSGAGVIADAALTLSGVGISAAASVQINADSSGTIGSVTITAAADAGWTVPTSWVDIAGEDGYRVKWGISSGSYTKTSPDLPANTTAYDIPNLTAGTTYYAVVVGFDSNGEGTPSTELVFVVGQPIGDFQAVIGNITVTADGTVTTSGNLADASLILGNITVSSAGQLDINGSATPTLGAIGISSDGSVAYGTLNADLNVTLSNVVTQESLYIGIAPGTTARKNKRVSAARIWRARQEIARKLFGG